MGSKIFLIVWTSVARINVAWANWNLFFMFPGTYLLSLVKVGTVTAEIFLIWRNVVSTNAAWTNVTVAVEIYFRCSEKPTFKVSLKECK